MIMSFKQRKIKFKPRKKLNHNIYFSKNHKVNDGLSLEKGTLQASTTELSVVENNQGMKKETDEEILSSK